MCSESSTPPPFKYSAHCQITGSAQKVGSFIKTKLFKTSLSSTGSHLWHKPNRKQPAAVSGALLRFSLLSNVPLEISFPQGLVDDNLLHSSQLHKLLASTRHAEKIVNLQVGQRGEIRKPGVKSEAMLFPSLLALELSNRRDTQSAPTRSCNLLWGDVVILAGQWISRYNKALRCYSPSPATTGFLQTNLVSWANPGAPTGSRLLPSLSQCPLLFQHDSKTSFSPFGPCLTPPHYPSPASPAFAKPELALSRFCFSAHEHGGTVSPDTFLSYPNLGKF